MTNSFLVWTQTDPNSFHPDSFHVDAFEGVPVVTPGIIVVLHAGTADAENYAASIRRELQDVLLSSGMAAHLRDDGMVTTSDPLREPVFGEPDRRRLVVIVGDGGTPFSPPPWLVPWQSAQTDSVMTIFPSGSNPAALLPTDALRAINASFWSKSATEAVPAILSSSGLTLEEHRVFISYRRVESEPLAEQLFDRLTHEGFDVFLDRFSIEPGVDFQRRLNQELADKAMVVLLESACIASSRWTQHEIDYTKRFRLGLLALRLPRSKPVPSIDADLRHVLRRGDFESGPAAVINPLHNPANSASREPAKVLQWGKLTRTALDAVVSRVKWTHDRAIFRRRHYLRDTMETALRASGVQNASLRPDGLLVAHAVDNANLYSVWMTTRPPEFSDFHVAHPKTLMKPVSKGVVIGPTALLESRRLERLTWLRGLCGFECLDEAEIADVARKIKEGVL